MNTPVLFRKQQKFSLTDLNDLVHKKQEVLYNLAFYGLGSEARANEAMEITLNRAYERLANCRSEALDLWLLAGMVKTIRGMARHNPASDPNIESKNGRSAKPQKKSSRNPNSLLACMSKLPVEQRLVVILVDMIDLEYDQAGAVLGIHPRLVSSRLAQGRREISQNLSVW
jgi:DNA-directed RNA polymerase specialized sigma24 family protein